MFKDIFSFEVRYQIRQPLFFICTAMFFLLTFGAVTTDEIMIGGAIGNVNRNAPFVIMQILAVMSVIGVFTTTAFVAGSTYRDVEHNTQALFFTTPISKMDYLLGRFAGSLTVSFLVLVFTALAIVIGSAMPWIEPDRIGAFQIGPYLFALFVIVLPNLLFTGSIFFSLAALTRSMMYTYASVVALFVGWGVAATLLRDVQNQNIASLLDPFGSAAFGYATRYWTVFEKNSSVLPLNGVLLYNRLLWSSVGLALLGLTCWRYRFATTFRKSKKQRAEEPEFGTIRRLEGLPSVSQDFSNRAKVAQYLHQAKLEVVTILKSLPFHVILALGVFNVIGSSTGLNEWFGTPVYPVTRLMTRILDGSFLLFLFLILTLYSGELVWKERSLRMNEVADALPVPTWAIWSSKLTALLVVQFSVILVSMLTAIGIQWYHGYTNFEFSQYAKHLFLITGIQFTLVSILAFFLQSIVDHKYFAFLCTVLYFVGIIALPNLHLEHHLYIYGTTPAWIYSDMNGFGHFVQPLFWFFLYWSFVASILALFSYLFWNRGTETRFGLRKRIAGQRFQTGPRIVLAIGVIGAVLTGTWIFYNTNILNHYRTRDEIEKKQAEFEKKYKKYETALLPKITDVKADVDIFPAERRVNIRGRYLMQNKRQQPIDHVHVLINPDMIIRSVVLDQSKLEMADKYNGYYIYRLEKAMQPGEVRELKYDLSVENHGFENDRSNLRIVYNGTFFDSTQYFPHLCYSSEFELTEASKRKKYGLPPVVRMPKLMDEAARQDNMLSREADWVNFETTVSTSPDQIAVSPGYLQKEWTEGNRRYFHYKMDSPILSFWSYLSARYAVKRDKWNDVNIEIYYQPSHPYNVDRMIDATKKSLDYFTKNFSPYQHKQVRILEFPSYAQFAQSFPNTIPYSESIGFIARIEKPEDIDFVYYVTAHEVAHQWWAHQLIGANVQGSTFLDETMAQYSALMVMEKQYGADQMRKFLKYELDRYLAGRGGELVEELPLKLVENQNYIHYNKGSLATYAFRDYVGEDEFNHALSSYVHAMAFQQPPYTTTIDFLSFVRPVVPEKYKTITADLFENITLYENKATDTTFSKLPDGRYKVDVTVESKKFRSDGMGKETEVPIDDWVDVGVLGEKSDQGQNRVLALEKKHITQPKMEFEFVVNALPKQAGIDPLNKLVDRNPGDNTKDL